MVQRSVNVKSECKKTDGEKGGVPGSPLLLTGQSVGHTRAALEHTRAHKSTQEHTRAH